MVSFLFVWLSSLLWSKVRMNCFSLYSLFNYCYMLFFSSCLIRYNSFRHFRTHFRTLHITWSHLKYIWTCTTSTLITFLINKIINICRHFSRISFFISIIYDFLMFYTFLILLCFSIFFLFFISRRI